MAGIELLLSALSFMCLINVSLSSHCANCIKREALEEPGRTHCSDTSTKYPLQVLVRKLPDPLIVKQGQKFDVSVTIHVTKKLPSKFLIDLDLWKKLGFWIKIPCISDVGSCDYNIDCNKMNCTQVLDMCTKCRVAIDDLTVTIPINVDFPSFLVNGKYWIGYKIYNAANKEPVACGEQYISIQI